MKRIWFRGDEMWIGKLGLFWSKDLKGIEFPSGRAVWL